MNFIFTRNQLKIIAYVIMIIDHIGAIIFTDILFFRIIGRLSFPIFAFLIADGVMRTRNITVMLTRLLLFSIISQPFYDYAFNNGLLFVKWNIFITLTFGAIGCYLFKHFWNTKPVILMFVVACLCFLSDFVFHSSYGYYGVLLVLGFYIVLDAKKKEHINIISENICVLSILTITYCLVYSDFIQYFAVLSGFILDYKKCNEKKMGSWCYFLYATHLFILRFFVYFLYN